MKRSSLMFAASLMVLFPANLAVAAHDERSVLQYRAPAANPAPRRIGGSSRGVPPSLPSVIALVPDHLGLTVQEQPTLYWYLSAATSARIEIVVIEPGVETPLLEVTAPGANDGMQRVDLSAHGVKLRPGVEYEWFVALIADNEQRSRDIVSGGAIMRVDRSVDQSQTPAAAAASGYWYDALMALEREPNRVTSDAVIREQRAALLDQVGLGEAALFERQR